MSAVEAYQAARQAVRDAQIAEVSAHDAVALAAADAFREIRGFGIGDVVNEDNGKGIEFMITRIDTKYAHDDPGINYVMGSARKKDGTWSQRVQTIYRPMFSGKIADK